MDWNKLVQSPPNPLTAPVTITPIVKRKILKMRETLQEPIQVLTNLETLHVEAKALSLFLYKNYRAMKKDKGIQFMKIILTSLKKYAEMDVARSVNFVLGDLPARFPALSNQLEVPTRAVAGWLLSRIQALAALFYRIFKLTKRAGLFLYGRIRLRWNVEVLFLCLGMAARIHATAKYLVLQCVQWHSSIIPFVNILPKPDVDPYKDYPKDLQEWLGGLSDLSIPTEKSKSSLDLIFDLVDLTKDDEDEQEDFVEIINDFRTPTDETDIERLCEIVTLESSQDSDPSEEDIGEVVTVRDESIVDETDSEPVMLPQSAKKLKRKLSKIGNSPIPLKKKKNEARSNRKKKKQKGLSLKTHGQFPGEMKKKKFMGNHKKMRN